MSGNSNLSLESRAKGSLVQLHGVPCPSVNELRCAIAPNITFAMHHSLVIVISAGDPTLAMWSKREEPVLPMPPPDMPLVGWRDPFIFEMKGKNGNGREWGMLMGSGLKGQGGAIMIYRSESLYGGMLQLDCFAESESKSEFVR